MRSAGRDAGNFADPANTDRSSDRARLADMPWTWLRQVHGAGVVVVERPGGGRGEEADAAVTLCPEAALAVVTADCAPVGLSSPEGVAGVVHAGWRGLMAGVVDAAVAAMRSLGARDIHAGLGPCILPHAYRFSAADLEPLVARFGPQVQAEDDDGYPALDLPAAVRAALLRAGAVTDVDARTCTHCSPSYWSWRARADRGRQATVVWKRAGQDQP